MVNHPNRKIAPNGADMYRPIDAVRLVLMVQKAIASLQKESSINAAVVTGRVLRNAYGGSPSPAWEGGIYPHVRKFCELVLAFEFDQADERLAQPLPDEDATAHSSRLRGMRIALDTHIEELKKFIEQR